MRIKLIWAQDLDGGIGVKNNLPWFSKEDLKNFKLITLNSTIIMGRKTWDSLKIKPLPKRRNIVLSSNTIKNVECYKSIDNLMNSLKDETSIFVIGGAQIYKIFYPLADELHISIINKKNNEIDTYFPVEILDIKKKYKKITSKDLSSDVTYTQWVKI
tara:strand:- start:324 stop:797 length:474 start_codon:yes stop_codon:yes gene_type:complete